jgi:hypothetical protein
MGKNKEVKPTYEWWNNEKLIAELDRRSVDLKNGNDKSISMEESRAYLINKFGLKNKVSSSVKELKEAEFDNLLNEAGEIAEENGLTEKRLRDLLTNED